MLSIRELRIVFIILFGASILALSNGFADNKPMKFGAFSIEHKLALPGSPDEIYAAFTEHIDKWWDHTFSEKPSRFYIEAKPGGGFYEIFDKSGDGVLHATVIYAQKGKILRFDGPLGLSGKALKLVSTLSFQAMGEDSTQLSLTLNASGEYEEGWPAVIDKVWHHFLFERFKLFVENPEKLE